MLEKSKVTSEKQKGMEWNFTSNCRRVDDYVYIYNIITNLFI